jgi:hypothetical protein
MTQVAYSDTVSGGLVAYLDSFQAQVAELITIDPGEYLDYRLKRLLLGNVQSIEGIQHLVQNCRDNDCKTYEECGAYLRKNSILIDSMKARKTPVRLMNVQDAQPEPISYDTSEKVTQLFHSVAMVEGIYPTYKMFALKTYRESLSIPDKIWAELEPMFKEKINEIRTKIRKQNTEQDSKPGSGKIPRQYPNIKPKESLINMVSSLATLDLNESDDDTDDEVIQSMSTFMVRSMPIDPPETKRSSSG